MKSMLWKLALVVVAFSAAADGRVMRGQVVDEATQQPLPNRVLAYGLLDEPFPKLRRLHANTFDDMAWSTVSLDGQGRFAFPAEKSGRYFFKLREAEYTFPLTYQTVTLNAGNPGRDLVYIASKGAMVDVTPVDSAGEAIALDQVQLEIVPDNDVDCVPGLVRNPHLTIPRQIGRIEGGAIQFGPLPPGKFQIRSSGDDGFRLEAGEDPAYQQPWQLMLEAGEHRKVGLTFERVKPVARKILLASGMPAAGAQVFGARETAFETPMIVGNDQGIIRMERASVWWQDDLIIVAGTEAARVTLREFYDNNSAKDIVLSPSGHIAIPLELSGGALQQLRVTTKSGTPMPETQLSMAAKGHVLPYIPVGEYSVTIGATRGRAVSCDVHVEKGMVSRVPCQLGKSGATFETPTISPAVRYPEAQEEGAVY